MSIQAETVGNQHMETYTKKGHKTLILKRLIKPGHWMEHMINPVTHHTKKKKHYIFCKRIIFHEQFHI